MTLFLGCINIYKTTKTTGSPSRFPCDPAPPTPPNLRTIHPKPRLLLMMQNGELRI
jgi:hypothetical protein